MDDIDYEKWTSFIIGKTKGSRKILEAACGTGSITRLLAQADMKVTAFDLSEDMLMRAYEKLGRNPGVKLLNQDMTDFKVDDRFDAAVCCCDGINYLTDKEVSSFFENVRDHLNDSGKFIFDMSTDYKYDTMFNETYVYDDGGVFYVWENMADEDGRKIDMEINFFIENEDGSYSRITEVQTQYVHSSEKITELLKLAGFGCIETYDDYNDVQGELPEKSLRAVFSAVKL